MGDLRVLSSGVDTLHVSARGTVRADLWDELDAARNQAAAGEPGPVELGDTGQVFEVQPHGWRFYGLWLRSPDYELMLGRNEKFPAAVAQLHSAYLHSMGVWPAVRLVESTLRRAVLIGPGEVCVSRIDLYADVQGWPLRVEDMSRFVARGRYRGGYPVGEEEGTERFWCLGRELTGFDFGRRGGPVYVRIYDKTTEIRRRGLSWLPDLWGDREADEPVWRVEAEVRRQGLVDLQLRAVEDVLAGLQDVWRYVTTKWLTYRVPTSDRRVRRWPIDPVWEDVQAIRLAPSELGVVRGRVSDAAEERLLSGATGYLSSLAGRHDEWQGLAGTLEHIRPILVRYLESRGRTWEALVAAKRAKRMEITGWADDPAVDAEDVA